MMESFLIDLFVRSLVVLALVGAMVFAVRRSSAAVRSLVWRIGTGLLLALPAMMALLPKWTLAWLPAAPQAVAYSSRYHGERLDIRTFAAHPPMPEPLSWIVAIYALGVVIGLVRLAASFGAASLISRRGVVVDRTPDYGIVLSTEAPMPFAFGLLRPSIVLPASALDWDPAVRNDVMAHEAAHVERQDWLWLLLGRIAAVLYWPNLGVAWMLHRARMDAEMAADDQVVAAGQDQVIYAEHLVQVARACRSTALLAPMAAEPPLTTRLRSLLSGDVRRNAPGRPAAHAAFVMGMLLVGPFAAMGFGPRPSPVVDVAAASMAVEEVTTEAGWEAETFLVQPLYPLRPLPMEPWLEVRPMTEDEARANAERLSRRNRVRPRRTAPLRRSIDRSVPPALAPLPPPGMIEAQVEEPAEEAVAPEVAVEAVESPPAVEVRTEPYSQTVQGVSQSAQTRRTTLHEQQLWPSRE